MAFLHGALHSEAVQHLAELRGGYEAVLVLIVQVEGIVELGVAAVRGVGAAEGGELREVNEAVVIGVKVFHDTLELLRRDAGSEGAEDVVQLRDGDLAVAVGVEAAEDSLQLLRVLQVHGGFGSRVRVGSSVAVPRFDWIRGHCYRFQQKEELSLC